MVKIVKHILEIDGHFENRIIMSAEEEVEIQVEAIWKNKKNVLKR